MQDVNQLAINFNPPRARKCDPDTSKSAAQSVSAFEADHFDRIKAALERAPGTIHDLATRTGLDHVQIARRLPEVSWAIPTEEKRPGPSGRPCRVWTIA